MKNDFFQILNELKWLDDLLTIEKICVEDRVLINISDALKKENLKIIVIIPDTVWLLVKEYINAEFPQNGPSLVQFALVEFMQGDNENQLAAPVFFGYGFSSTLRECRHTYWGDNGKGYLFYPNGKAIALAFNELSCYFDEMI